MFKRIRKLSYGWQAPLGYWICKCPTLFRLSMAFLKADITEVLLCSFTGDISVEMFPLMFVHHIFTL